MMTVRFSTGFSIQYNTANHVLRSGGYSDLYTKKDGTWLAQVPNSAVIEGVPPCRTYHAGQAQDQQAALEAMSKELRAIRRKLAKKEVAR